MIDLKKDVHVFSTPEQVGRAAGMAIESRIVKLQEYREKIRIVFAAAPSQDTMLEYLSKSTQIQWHKIVAFNMDEYLGLPQKAPQLFAEYLEKHLFSKVQVKEKNTINPMDSVDRELERYANLIDKESIDVVCLGIGENGHIAFNDPPVADFNDAKTIKVVELDDECRVQQVNDGCFATVDDVPKKALTLTIPTLLSGDYLFCVVLGVNKSNAVRDTLQEPISTSCPATILRTHENCSYYFDEEAYSCVENVQIDVLNK
ncbi:6-phosphogluconolactonase [Wenyingzhuangia sp. 1_MG-2023]|nr:6-phosphogluconolactonase [Wenyingzhuangia sp. 1_MG-2023]